MFLRRSDDGFMVGDIDSEVGGDVLGSAIARRNEQGINQWRLRDLPGQGMFAPTRTNDHYAHVLPPCRLRA